LRKTLNDRIRPLIAETRREIIVAHCSSSHWWGDEGDPKMFEMPFIRRDDRQVIDSSGRGDCRVLKAGGASRRHCTVKHATGFQCRT